MHIYRRVLVIGFWANGMSYIPCPCCSMTLFLCLIMAVSWCLPYVINEMSLSLSIFANLKHVKNDLHG